MAVGCSMKFISGDYVCAVDSEFLKDYGQPLSQVSSIAPVTFAAREMLPNEIYPTRKNAAGKGHFSNVKPVECQF